MSDLSGGDTGRINELHVTRGPDSSGKLKPAGWSSRQAVIGAGDKTTISRELEGVMRRSGMVRMISGEVQSQGPC